MTQPMASRRLRKDVINALRKGVVPSHGLHLYATGIARFTSVIDDELADVAVGRSVFKAVRAPYGGGKTFFSRWLQARALQQNFAVTEVQISANETPLYKLETVYRRAMQFLRTESKDRGAFREIIDGWLYTLEEELQAAGKLTANASNHQVHEAVGEAMESKLKELSAQNPQFSAVLRAYHRCQLDEDEATAEGLIAWLCGEPGISASIKRKAGVKGEIDTRMAFNFFHGLTLVLGFSGRKGLVLVLDEVETIQRQRRDTREKSLNGLRQLIDYTGDQRLPNVYLLITGTPEFFDGDWGVKRLEPLAQRLETHFSKDPANDNIRDPQIRLLPFEEQRLYEVGRTIRALYPANDPERLIRVADDSVVGGIVERVLGSFRGKVGVAPRIFLKKLVGILDRINDNPDFNPKSFLAEEFNISVTELSDEERTAAGASAPKSSGSTRDDLDELDIAVDET
jgi:hypothetical protein